jgi:hypothetical protein
MTIDISQSFETIEEASLYFRDASMENPQRRRAIFPTVSSPSAVVPPSTTKGLELSLPFELSRCSHYNVRSPMSTGTADVFDRSSVSYGAPVRSSQQEREQDLRPMRLEFWDDERLFDESSCGSLDYSLDDDGEEDTQAGVSSQKQALIVWDLDVYYVFPRPRSEETKYHKCCFELPLSRWITSLFCNHHGR